MEGKNLHEGEASSRQSEIRCLNCFERFFVPLGSERITCNKCGMEWRISWVSSKLAKIRGPVWEKLPKETKN